MSVANPTYTASSVINDIEARLRTPGISSSVYLPWVATAYNRLRQKLERVGQQAKEEYFGAYATIALTTATPNEYSMNAEIERFGSFIKVEVKYGAATDDWHTAQRLRSVSQWKNWNNISTDYRSKDNPLYYKFGDTLGFIPVPPETNAQAKVWYVQRGYQISDVTDEIDIPYRFIYPILTYVQARAIERAYEDYATAKALDRQFERELDEVAEAAASEFDEDQGAAVEGEAYADLNYNPFNG